MGNMGYRRYKRELSPRLWSQTPTMSANPSRWREVVAGAAQLAVGVFLFLATIGAASLIAASLTLMFAP